MPVIDAVVKPTTWFVRLTISRPLLTTLPLMLPVAPPLPQRSVAPSAMVLPSAAAVIELVTVQSPESM